MRIFAYMTIAQANDQLKKALVGIYESREALLIAQMVLEKLTGLERVDQYLKKDNPLSAEQEKTWTAQRAALMAGRPVQYVLQEAWFAGMPFYVDENVLIPRPETEELVSWVAEETVRRPRASLMDIGTGSGCIAIALKKKLPEARVYGMDISAGALAVAQKNARHLGCPLNLVQTDILQPNAMDAIPPVDVIVSNPPYIAEKEKMQMAKNVLDYEPATALFVSDNDPLLFYRAIGKIALKKLRPGGILYFEINELYGPEVMALLYQIGFQRVICRQDMQGKTRMVKAENG